MKCPQCKREAQPWDGGQDHGPDFTGPQWCLCGWQESIDDREKRMARAFQSSRTPEPTAEFIERAVEDYRRAMRDQGHEIPPEALPNLRRAAKIQYAWFCAFTRAMK